jgi:hypothetical protein
MVFLSHCLLDENTRCLGGACRPGCVEELVVHSHAARGRHHLPCPEQHAWAGVLKRHMLRLAGRGGVGDRKVLLAISPQADLRLVPELRSRRLGQSGVVTPTSEPLR